jgi:hypothetical protein
MNYKRKFRQISNQALCYQVSLKTKPKEQAAKQQLKSWLEKKIALVGLNKRKEKINILKQHGKNYNDSRSSNITLNNKEKTWQI